MRFFVPLLLATFVLGDASFNWNGISDGPRVITDQSQTVIAFPTADDWWTIGSINVLEWWWAPTTAVQLNVLLFNKNFELLPWGTNLVNGIDSRMLSMYTKDLESALPGHGYQLILVDAANTTHRFAESDLFEIRGNGSEAVINPAPYGPIGVDKTSGASRVKMGGLAAGAVLMSVVLSLVA